MKKTRSVGFQLFALALGVIVLIPVLYALSVSFMKPDEILSREVNLLPRSFYLGNYIAAFQKTTLTRFLLNSFVMTVGSSTVRLVTAGTAAFALSFYNFRGKQAMFLLIIGTMMIPPDLLIVKTIERLPIWA